MNPIHNLIPLDLSFLEKKVNLSWKDILWGYEKNLLTKKDIVNHACNEILKQHNNESLINLASKQEIETESIYELLKQIAGTLDGYDSSKWLYLVLLHIFLNREKYVDPLGEVEILYADFDYPEEIESFVRYMPPKGYNPNNFSLEQNIERLYNFWENYLKKKEIEFGSRLIN